MYNFGLQINDRRLKAKIALVRSDLNTKAAVRALNKVANQAVNQAVRAIRKSGYQFKAKDIKGKIKIRRATESTPYVSIRVYNKAVPLIEFGARQTKQGVTVNVKNGRKLIRGAFIATMPSGHKGVYIRVGESHKKVSRGKGVVWQGLPIKQLYGPSVAASFANDVVMSTVQTFIRDKFPELYKHEVEYLRSSWVG